MADTKISALSSGAPAEAGDEYVIARSGSNFKLTLTNIAGNMPATTISSGNLIFSSTGQRITGDMSNATLSNRLAFQTSTTNGNTIVGAFPNGTGTNTRLQLFSASDPANASTASMETNATSSLVIINADRTGTGTYLPMTFYTGGSERFRIGTTGQLGIGGANYGTSGQVLTSNGSGAAPSWQTIGGSSLRSQTFLASGTFTVPTGVTSVWVTMIGGGGSGASGNGARGGGGSGSYCFKRPLSVTAGASLTVTVGGGGAGAANGNTGNDGSNTVFDTITVTGGIGGGKSPTTANTQLAGAGGSIAGAGSNATDMAPTNAFGSILGGKGGRTGFAGTSYGGGGGGGFEDGTDAATGAGNSAAAAANSGAGSGAVVLSSGGASGNGGSGRVIIEWFA